jgi:hypothetical protein
MRARAAALFARLEHHGALRHQIRCGREINHRTERRVQVLEIGGLLHRLFDFVGELPIGAFLEPLLALGRGLAKQRLQVHRRRRAPFLRGLDRYRAAGGGLQPEAHHRLVDRAICSTSSAR